MTENKIIDYLIAGITSTIVPAFMSVSDMLTAILITAICNGIAGYLADKKQGYKFSGKKALKVFNNYALILICILVAIVICKLMNEAEAGYSVLNYICWAYIIYHAINIMRNLELARPDDGFLKFANYLIRLKFLKKNEIYKLINDYESERESDNINKEA